MLVIESNNASELIYKMLKHLMGNKKEYTSRNGNMLETRPVCLELTNPRNRTIFLPKRKNNIFATIAETAWFFSGKNRIDDFLVHFLPRAKDYSDDGVTWRGAYGPRLRYWSRSQESIEDLRIAGTEFTLKGPVPTGSYKYKVFDASSYPINQIQYVIDVLKENHDSRRALIEIYDPERDSKPGKDIPCFTENTLVCSPVGDITFGDLYKKSMKPSKRGKKFKYPVFSANIHTGRVEVKWARNIRMTKNNAKIIRVHFDDGTSLEVTGSHKFYIRHKKKIIEVPAEMLRPGYSVIPLHVIEDNKGYRHFINNFFSNSSYRNKYKIHRAVAEFYLGRNLKADEVVHHIDENKGHNNWKNLEVMTHEEHNILERGVYNPKDKSMFSDDDLIEIGVEAVNKNGKLTRDSFNSTAKELDKDVRYYTVHKRFGSFKKFRDRVEEVAINNHRVVHIEIVSGRHKVYNMAVDDNHNYFVGSGVLVGNCNVSLDFKLRDNKLDMMVTNRSNDIIWGYSGVNIFIFSFLQEVIANSIGSELGTYYHISNSMHLYYDMFRRAELILKNYEDFGLYNVPYHKHNGVGNYDDILSDSEKTIHSYINGGSYESGGGYFARIVGLYKIYQDIIHYYKSFNNNSDEKLVKDHIHLFISFLLNIPFDIRISILNYVLRQVRANRDDKFNDNFIKIIGDFFPKYISGEHMFEYIFRG